MDLNVTNHSSWFEKHKDVEEAIKRLEERKEAYVAMAIFLCTVLFVAVIFRELLRKFHFPYTVLLFLFGIVLGVVDNNFKSFHPYTRFAKLPIVIQLFMPIIFFDFAFGMNPYLFMMSISQCLILAVPGFAFCATLNAVFAETVFTVYKWNWRACILFGTILCATDPSSVIDILKEYGTSPSLTTIIEGESLLNNAIAFVLSHSILKVFDGTHKGFEDVASEFFLSCLGALAFGYVVAMLTVALLRLCENDTDMEVTFTLCTSYITYFVSEIYLGISGLLALVVLGVSVSSYKSSINYEEEETTLHQFWQTMSFWAKSFIFTVVGLNITSSAFNDLEYSDIGLIIATYFTISVIRYGAVLTWGGMRGATGLSIALMSQYTPMEGMHSKILIQVSGVIVLTLIFNASTMRFLFKLLGIGKVTYENVESMAHAVALLKDAVRTAERATRMDKYTSGVDWAWIHRVTQIENPYEKKGTAYTTSRKRGIDTFRGHCQECKAEVRIEPNVEELKKMEAESRLIIMRALKTSVANQHESYAVLRRTVGLLSTCIDNTISEKYLLAEDVKKKVLRVNYYQKLVKKYMMDTLQRFRSEERQNKVRLRSEEPDSSAFRKWCIKLYLSRSLDHALFLALLLNVIPIAGEITLVTTGYRLFHHSGSFEKEILLFEIFGAILTLWYVFDAVVRIYASGYKLYFKSKGNVVDFIVTLISVMQCFYGIVLMSVHRYTYSKTSFYVLVGLNFGRIIRQLKVTIVAIFKNVLNQFSSVFYNSFDLAVGFVVANEEIAKSAHKMVEYKECAEYARYIAENNAYEMLCYIDEIEEEHPHEVCAWRSHRAAIYVLRNMKEMIEEMVDIYMLDEADAEMLMDAVEGKMKETLSASRFMTSALNVQNCLSNLQWIKNDEILDEIMETHSIQSFQKGEVIQEAGKQHSSIQVLYKGIIQVTGSNSGEKENSLPNTDTLQYFDFTGLFSVHVNYPKTLGLLGYLLQTPSVTNVVSSKDSQMITVNFEKISEIEEKFGSLSFYMWRSIALRIAYLVLSEQNPFENWSVEKLKIHLEEGIFPDLLNVKEFSLHPIIIDAVLIQGRVKSKDADTVYTGPAFIPHSVRSLILLDDPNTRPRVVMVLFREEKYHVRSTMSWVGIDEITHIGLCVVHGVRRATLFDSQIQHETGRRKTFLQTMGQLLKPKGGNIMAPNAP